MTTAIVVAAGKSTRMGQGSDKTFMALAGKPVVAWSLLALERSREIDRIVLVVRKDQLTAAKALSKMFGISKLDKIVQGGAKRSDSVQAGLKACDIDTTLVVVHDGARPLITSETISAVVKAAKVVGPVTVGRKMVDTVKKVKKDEIVDTVDRDELMSVQTPQVFPIGMLKKAYDQLKLRNVTDDCQVVELAGNKVHVFETNAVNLKITTVEDLQIASALLA